MRWLRPDFQHPQRRSAGAGSAATPALQPGAPAPAPADDRAEAALSPAAPAPVARQPWPGDLEAQLRSVAEVLAASPGGQSDAQLAERYTGRGPWEKRLADVLATLEAVARARCEGGVWRGM